MATTPVFGWTVMDAADPSDAPNQVMDLATEIENTVNTRFFLRKIGGDVTPPPLEPGFSRAFPSTVLVDSAGDWAGYTGLLSSQWTVPVDGMYLIQATMVVYRHEGLTPDGLAYLRLMGDQDAGADGTGVVIQQNTASIAPNSGQGPILLSPVVYMATGTIYGLSVLNSTDLPITMRGIPSRTWYFLYYLGPNLSPGGVNGNGPADPNEPPNPADEAAQPVPISEVDQTGLDLDWEA